MKPLSRRPLPDNTFGDTDLMIAGKALSIVHGIVADAIGERQGAEAIEALYDLASSMRGTADASGGLPAVDVNWPREAPSGGSGDMAFHVASGGTEYDGITLNWRTGEDGRLSFVYGYDGRDEIYEPEEAERD